MPNRHFNENYLVIANTTAMTFLSILTVLLATVVMGFIGLRKQVPVEAVSENPRKRNLPKRWSNFLIAMTVVYFFLLLAGLGYAGWFRIA